MHQYLNCSILAMVSCHTKNKTQALTLATSPTEPTFVSPSLQPHQLPLSALPHPFWPCWPSLSFFNKPSLFWPQGLCTGCSFWPRILFPQTIMGSSLSLGSLSCYCLIEAILDFLFKHRVRSFCPPLSTPYTSLFHFIALSTAWPYVRQSVLVECQSPPLVCQLQEDRGL